VAPDGPVKQGTLVRSMGLCSLLNATWRLGEVGTWDRTGWPLGTGVLHVGGEGEGLAGKMEAR
jgi:hypothetical protein